MTATNTASTSIDLKGRDFLRVADLSPDELVKLLDVASHLKHLKRNREPHRLLEGRSMAMYFEKPSNRTRVSFEVAMVDLGIHPIPLRKEEIQLGVRETIGDTARTLSRYVDGIVIRTFAQSDVEELAEYATIPIINGLTDEHHPCQILADLLTMKDFFGDIKGKKMVFVGDGENNIAHSLLEGCAMAGVHITLATPKGFLPHGSILKRAEELASASGAQIEINHSPEHAVVGAHAVYTDVWASMGKEGEAQKRREEFCDFQVSEALMSKADANAIVLHCLPAHQGEEITHGMLEAHAKSIFEQAENRLHAQKALLASAIQ